jgi:hypothetical protein
VYDLSVTHLKKKKKIKKKIVEIDKSYANHKGKLSTST